MDRNQLEIELRNFCRASIDRDYPITIQGLSEAYPGVYQTSFTVHIQVAKWGGGISCSEILDKIIPILFETTSEEARQMIFSLDVYNAVDGINCHHIDTFTQFELAC